MKNTSPQLVFFLLILVLMSKKVVSSQNTTISVNVGVVLDMNTKFGKMGWNSINMALTDFYMSNPNYTTRIVLHTRDFEKDDVVTAAAAALSLIKNEEVIAILGPDSSMQTDVVINLGDKALVPIITFSATSPSLSSRRSQYFFRAALNDSSQVQAISSVIKTFEWRQVVPIYVDNEFGAGVIPYLTDALQMIDVRVPYRSVIPPSANDDHIEKELYKLMTMQTRVFVMHMRVDLGARVFKMAEKIGMMSDGYVWIVTNGVADELNLIQPSVIANSMQGVVGVKAYVPNSESLEDFEARWKKNNPDLHLNIYTLWAYDATFALAMAIEKVNPTAFTYLKNTSTSSTLTDLETLGTSQCGLELQGNLTTIRFKGLAGDFNLVDRQLQASVFQLINVGKGEQDIGFWTPGNGISKDEVVSRCKLAYPDTEVIPYKWPGDIVPEGWVIPTNEKRLKIGVPFKKTYNFEFVKVDINNSTNRTTVTGYCIDVFKAVLEAMPFNVPYDFVPFELPQGSGSPSYDDMVKQVSQQKYDAVVGDVTILLKRSEYVDFTLPYTETDVSMIVPIKDRKSKSPFLFVHPWSGSLYLATIVFFVFIGFVTWVLEHRINEDFRGPPSLQAATIFLFSFSTLVFAHKEKVLSGWGRFVVVVWLFVVLILTQTYTASLTTMLTVRQLKPALHDVNELLKTDQYVGYPHGSYVVLEVLRKLQFHESKIRAYNNSEECNELLMKGSANGGIGAAFDETPYLWVFLDRHCSNYTIVGPVYRTLGFGFVFPRGSSLVAEVSRAILKVTEGDKMQQIDRAWFGTKKTCPGSNDDQLSSNRLGLDAYSGLFIVAAVISLLALLSYAATLFNDHKRAMAKPNSQPTTILQHFHSKARESPAFRRSEETQSEPTPVAPSSHGAGPTSGNPIERARSIQLTLQNDQERQGDV